MPSKKIEKKTYKKVGVKDQVIEKLQKKIKMLQEKNKSLLADRKKLFILDQVLRVVPEHVYWKDKKSNYLGCNKQFAKAAGFKSSDEIIGKNESDINHINAKSIIKNDKLIISKKQPQVIEEMGNDKNHFYISHKTPLMDENGSVCGLVGISVDISERKHMENELLSAKDSAEFSNKVKTEMIRNLSHDIRTPLAGIIGMTELVTEEYPDTKERMEEMRFSAESLLSLLNSIMDVSQLESGSMVEKNTQFSLNELIADVITCFLPAAHEKELVLESHIDPSVPDNIESNYHFLHQIIFNLIGNALKFTEKGSVEIFVEKIQKNDKEFILKISVKDTGPGIPEDKKLIIFEPFNKLTPSYESKYVGSGLGLYIVKELVQKLDGKISVVSSLGQGATFVVEVPLKMVSNSIKKDNLFRQSNNNLGKSSNKKIKVLLVEDNEIVKKTGELFLKKWGFDVDAARTGKEALDKTMQEKFDFIYMDVGLPDIDGKEVTKQIRGSKDNLNQSTPIVALTAHADKSITQECLNVGMKEVLIKPMNEDNTRRVISEYAEKTR